MPSHMSLRTCVPLQIIIRLCNLKNISNINKRKISSRSKVVNNTLDPVSILCSMKTHKCDFCPSYQLPSIGCQVISINRLKSSSPGRLNVHCFYGTVVPVPSGSQYAQTVLCIHYHCIGNGDVYSVEYFTMDEFAARRMEHVPQEYLARIVADGVSITSDTVILCDIML